MRRLPWFASAAAVLVLGLVGCGKKSSTETPGPSSASVADDVTALVPNDAVAMLYVPSLDGLIAKAKAVVASVDPSAANDVSLEPLLEDAPPSVRDNLDRTKPLAIAVSFPAGSDDPVITGIVPTKDPAPVVKEIEAKGAAKPATSGKYVGFTMGPQPQGRGSADIAKRVPAGDLSVRVNLSAIVTRFRPMIDEQMAQMTGQMSARGGERPAGVPDPMAMLAPMVDGVKAFLDGADWLDLAIRAEGSRVDVDVEFRAKEGSRLVGKFEGSKDLAALAGRIPKDFPVAFLVSADAQGLMEMMKPLWDAALASMPEEQRSAFSTSIQKSMETNRYYGREMVVAGGIGENGIEGVSLRASKEPKTALAKSNEAAAASFGAASAMGMTLTTQPPTTIQGVEVTRMKFDFDVEKMMASQGQAMPPEAGEKVQGVMQLVFGPEGLVIHNAAVDGAVVTAIGAPAFLDQAFAAAKKKGDAPGTLGAALQRAGSKPSLVVHLEARALARQALGLARKVMPPDQVAQMPTVPDGKPATLLVHATGEGRVYRGGLSVDVGAWAELIKSLDK